MKNLFRKISHHSYCYNNCGVLLADKERTLQADVKKATTIDRRIVNHLMMVSHRRTTLKHHSLPGCGRKISMSGTGGSVWRCCLIAARFSTSKRRRASSRDLVFTTSSGEESDASLVTLRLLLRLPVEGNLHCNKSGMKYKRNSRATLQRNVYWPQITSTLNT